MRLIHKNSLNKLFYVEVQLELLKILIGELKFAQK